MRIYKLPNPHPSSSHLSIVIVMASETEVTSPKTPNTTTSWILEAPEEPPTLTPQIVHEIIDFLEVLIAHGDGKPLHTELSSFWRFYFKCLTINRSDRECLLGQASLDHYQSYYRRGYYDGVELVKKLVRELSKMEVVGPRSATRGALKRLKTLRSSVDAFQYLW